MLVHESWKYFHLEEEHPLVRVRQIDDINLNNK